MARGDNSGGSKCRASVASCVCVCEECAAWPVKARQRSIEQCQLVSAATAKADSLDEKLLIKAMACIPALPAAIIMALLCCAARVYYIYVGMPLR